MGYLVPEFPGQTHNFFWREIQALALKGVRACLISTRRPPAAIMSTSWGVAAEGATSYLFPLKAGDVLRVLGVLLAAGPPAWYRCIACIWRAEGVSALRKFRMLALIPMAAKLVVAARRDGWRHVHVHSCADAANVALFAKWLGGIEYSLTLHNPLSVYGGNQRQKWRHAEFAIVITRALLREVRHTLGADLPAILEVAPMGVDTSVFKRSRPYRPYDGHGVMRVFCCARLNPAKGHRFLIAAIAKLRREGLAIVLEIAGEDDVGGSGHRRELESLIQTLGLGEQVRLLGAVSEEVVRERLLETHVFALASLEEPLGVAIMEAMAMEVPVVATRAGGVPELIVDGIDGMLVGPGDADAIAEALRTVCLQPELALRLSSSSRRRIVDGFTSERSASVIAGLVGRSVRLGVQRPIGA